MNTQISTNDGAQSGASLPPRTCSASVLDACCGERSFWFDPKDSRAVFVDIRKETITRNNQANRQGPRILEVNPDIVADFTALPFPSSSFVHVVFDPPHIVESSASGNVAKYYGVLRGEWRDELRNGFAECFRVLRPGGTLVFKWNEIAIPLAEILALTPERPLYGHRSGKKHNTHWVAFLKPNK